MLNKHINKIIIKYYSTIHPITKETILSQFQRIRFRYKYGDIDGTIIDMLNYFWYYHKHLIGQPINNEFEQSYHYRKYEFSNKLIKINNKWKIN